MVAVGRIRRDRRWRARPRSRGIAPYAGRAVQLRCTGGAPELACWSPAPEALRSAALPLLISRASRHRRRGARARSPMPRARGTRRAEHDRTCTRAQEKESQNEGNAHAIPEALSPSERGTAPARSRVTNMPCSRPARIWFHCRLRRYLTATGSGGVGNAADGRGQRGEPRHAAGLHVLLALLQPVPRLLCASAAGGDAPQRVHPRVPGRMRGRMRVPVM
jgi:hypothetical protein